MSCRIEPALTSDVIPDLIRDPGRRVSGVHRAIGRRSAAWIAGQARNDKQIPVIPGAMTASRLQRLFAIALPMMPPRIVPTTRFVPASELS
jgi:hypothetical protein